MPNEPHAAAHSAEEVHAMALGNLQGEYAWVLETAQAQAMTRGDRAAGRHRYRRH